jgi:acetone carboxylase gamma subunit
MTETLVLRHGEDDRTHVDCAECGYRYGPAGRDPRLRAVTTEQLVVEGGEVAGEGSAGGATAGAASASDTTRRATAGVLARRYYCPSCALLFAVGVRAQGEPVGAERTDTDVEFTFARVRDALNEVPAMH